MDAFEKAAYTQQRDQFSSNEISFEDEGRALILLSSLSERWGATMIAVNSSSGSSKLKFEQVQNLILFSIIPAKRCSALASIQELKRCYFDALLIAVIVGEFCVRQIFVPTLAIL